MLGTPAFIQSAGLSLLALVMKNSPAFYSGDASITTYGMTSKIVMMVIMPILGIVQGFQPIAGYNYGARNFGRVRSSLYTTLVNAFVVSLFGYSFMMLWPRVAMGFSARDTALIASSARVLRIIVLFIPLAAIQITGSTYFQAVGKKTQSLLRGLSRQFILLIPIVVVLPRFIGLDGVWIAFPIADGVSTMLTVTLLSREIRRLDRHAADGVSA